MFERITLRSEAEWYDELMIESYVRVFLKGTINNRRPVSTGWPI